MPRPRKIAAAMRLARSQNGTRRSFPAQASLSSVQHDGVELDALNGSGPEGDSLSRRGFLRGVGAAGLGIGGAGLLTGLLGGCSSGGGNSGPAPGTPVTLGASINGQVSDQITRQPIPGALVTVVVGGAQFTGATGSTGKFNIPVQTGSTSAAVGGQVTVAAANHVPASVQSLAIGPGPTPLAVALTPLIPPVTVQPTTQKTVVQTPASLVNANPFLGPNGGAPNVTLPTGTTKALTVSVTPASPVSTGQWQNSGGSENLPGSPNVVVQIGTTNGASDIPGNATAAVPTFIPQPTGTTVPVQVGTNTTNVGAGTVTGTVQADATVQVEMSDVLTALGIGGLGRSRDFGDVITFVLQVVGITLSPAFVVTSSAPVNGTAVAANNCAGPTTIGTASFTEPLNNSVQAAINDGGQLVTSLGLLNSVLTALGYPYVLTDTTVDFQVSLPPNTTGSLIPVKTVVSVSGSAHGQDTQGNTLGVTLSGGFNLWSVDASGLTVCGSTGLGSR
jgi:hypothetical protein